MQKNRKETQKAETRVSNSPIVPLYAVRCNYGPLSAPTMDQAEGHHGR